jgi:hypothetical protein
MGRSHVVNLANFQQFTAINVLTDAGAIGGPVVIPGCVQIAILWSLPDGKIGTNILTGHAGGVPAPTVAQAQGIFAALSSGAQFTAMNAFLTGAGGLSAVHLRSIDSANQPIVSSTGAGVSGTGPGLALPNEVALVVTLRTALTGRANRGRMYIPNWTLDALAPGNVVLPAAVTATTNWANTIFGALTAQGYTWVVGQRARAAYIGSTGTAHPARAATFQPVSSALARDGHWDSQRRRGLK